jgi:hypothetical protein
MVFRKENNHVLTPAPSWSGRSKRPCSWQSSLEQTTSVRREHHCWVLCCAFRWCFNIASGPLQIMRYLQTQPLSTFKIFQKMFSSAPGLVPSGPRVHKVFGSVTRFCRSRHPLCTIALCLSAWGCLDHSSIANYERTPIKQTIWTLHGSASPLHSWNWYALFLFPFTL